MTEHKQNGDGDSTLDTNATVPVVKLLDDKPSDHDDTGGGHKRVAEAIARLIEREKGGKAIALEGSWGSGKSSAVRMLEEACGDNTVVYTFDAWKHEADPLRIAFLRGLFERLKKRRSKPEHEPWIKPGHHRAWKKALDQFERGSGVTRNVHAALLRKKDLAAIWALLTAPIVLALGVAIFASDLQADIRYVVAAIALLFALIVASVPLWSIGKAKPTFPSTEYEEDPGSEHEPSVAQIMLTRQPAHVVTRFNGPPPVTSLSFERLFKLLVRRALQAEQDRRLVIVIDNLDRLSTEDALKVWTTMRVFLEMDQQASPWLDRFWLVVPYDRTALAELWNGESTSPTQPVDTGAAATGAVIGNKVPTIRHSRPSSFLDKTFAVRFDVPPLLLANWETALGGYLEKALGTLATPEAKDAIARLSRRFAFGQKHPPTPRHLKLFVNDIGALVRQHGTRLHGVADETKPEEVVFSLESLAAYAILRREPMSPEDIREDLRTGAKRMNDILPAGWLNTQEPSPLTPRDQALACLVFNTHKPREAMELLLVQPLSAAIRDGDIEALDNLAGIPAAVRVIGEEQDRIASAIQPDDVHHLQRILATLETAYDKPGPLPKRLISRFARAMYAPDRSLNDSTELPELVRRFVKLAPREDILAWLAAALDSDSLTATGRFSGEDLATSRAILHAANAGPAVSSDRPRDIPIPKGPQRAARFLSQFWSDAETTVALWDRLHAEGDASLLNQILPEDDYASWSEDSFASLRVLAHCNTALVDWDVAGSRLASRLQTHPGEAGILNLSSTRFLRGDGVNTHVASDRMAAKVLERVNIFSKYLDALYQGATLDELLVAAVGKKNWTLAAHIVIEIGSRRNLVEVSGEAKPATTSRPHMNDILNKPEEFGSLVQAMAGMGYNGLRQFVQRRITKHDGELLLHAVFQAIDNDAVAYCLPVDWILSQWADIEAVDEGNGVIESRILQVHEYADGDRNRSLSNAIAEAGVKDHQIRLVQSMAERDNLNPALKNAIHKRMAGLDKNQWISEISKRLPLYALLETLPPEDRPTLDAAFRMAVESIAAQLVSEPNTIRAISTEEKATIFSVLPKHLGYTLRDNLRLIATGAPKDKCAKLYEVFGPEISEAMLEDPRERDGPDILLPIFIGSTGSDPEWLPQFIEDERSPCVVAKSDRTKQVFLIEAVRKRMASEGDGGGLFTSLFQRCDKAGLVPPEDPEAPEDSAPAQP